MSRDPDRPFIFGHRYRVIKKCRSLLKGREYVYMASTKSIYDGMIGFYFSNPLELDGHRRLDFTFKAFNNFVLEQSFEDLGEDMEIRHFDFSPMAVFSKSDDWDYFRKHLDYFKTFVEGQEGILSWYVWIVIFSPELQQHITRGTYMRLKLGGVEFAADILTRHQISYQLSPRYLWTVYYKV